MNYFSKRGIYVSLIALCCFLSACGGSASDTSTSSAGKGCMHIGVSMPDTVSSIRWETFDVPLLQQEISSYLPESVLSTANAGGSPAVQRKQVDTMLSKDGDCILIVAPEDANAAAAIVSDAQKKNVPVISYDRLIFSSAVSYYVSFDAEEVGVLQGEYIAQHYKSYVEAAGTNNVIMIEGSQDDSNALYFHQGVMKVLQPLFQSGALKNVYESYTSGWSPIIASKNFDSAFSRADGKVAIAYVANDSMAAPIISYLQDQNLNGKVLVTGQDASASALQSILVGNMDMTVFKPYDLEVTATAQLVTALSSGSSVSPLIAGRTTAVPGIKNANIPSILEKPILIDKSNVKQVFDDGYVTKSALCTGLPSGVATDIC